MITKISKEDSTTKVIGPSNDAITDVLEARQAARNDYGLAPLKDSDPSRSHPGTFQMVSDFNIREVEDLRDEYTDLYQGRPWFGHESNPNRDDLFKDLDANAIVSHN